MKILIGFICFLLVLVGAAYGLAKIHIIPVAMLAKSSPIAKTLLTQLKLYKPIKPKPMVAVAAAPVVDPLAAEKAQIAMEQAQVSKERTQLAQKLAAALPPPPPPVVQTAPQLIEIYEAMNSDDLATLFAKEPDSAVVSALIAMDTKKAAKALAAIPPDRGARITALMNQAIASLPNTPQQPTP
jgi:hypothetical protein